MKTIQDLLNLSEALVRVGQLKGSKFVYAIARNINLLKPEIEKYSEARKVLLESFAKKNKDGTPIIKDNSYDIPDMKEYNVEFAKLLKEKVKEIGLYKIEQRDLPADITAEQLSGIFSLINEEAPSKK